MSANSLWRNLVCVALAAIMSVGFVCTPAAISQGVPKDKQKSVSMPGSFLDRVDRLSPGVRDWFEAPRERKDATPTDEAIVLGLRWIVRQQLADGSWRLDRDATQPNDVAATALGLLPLLATGATHKPARDNLVRKPIERGLQFLLRSQNPRTGYLGTSAYGHGLATIALCEAYGLSRDPALRAPAQKAIQYIVDAQHDGGGWRYSPKTPGDLSVSGWQILALKTGQMAGLDVPAKTLQKAAVFLDFCSGNLDTYGYTGPSNAIRTTAIGALGRQYLQSWGPNHPRMQKSVNNHLKAFPPDRADAYYRFYASQVMYHHGGEAWKDWNEKATDYLLKQQQTDQLKPTLGSWGPEGDPFGKAGGRLMVTSLNLLVLEMSFRYAPLFRGVAIRDEGK